MCLGGPAFTADVVRRIRSTCFHQIEGDMWQHRTGESEGISLEDSWSNHLNLAQPEPAP